jgi:hypothetical protein
VSPSARSLIGGTSEDLDMMERSPNLPLQFADENLKPSASCGLNAFVDHFAVAMKRSTSPISGGKSEPQLIETAPRDGGFLILEEDISGRNDIGRWASEAGGWVRENGQPIEIRPSYWYPIEVEIYLQHGPDVSISPSQRGAAPQQQFASELITSLWERLLPRPATAKIDSTAVELMRASFARNRFAVFSFAASLVVAVCVGVYFRADQNWRQSLLQERDRVAALARELSDAAEEADRLGRTANAATADLEQERSRSAALARDLESAQRMIAARSTTERQRATKPAR